MQYPRGHTSPRPYWLRWAETLRRYQLDGFVSWLLDAGRPLALLSAQVLYLGSPFLGEDAQALARTLESDDETSAFASFLDSEERVQERDASRAGGGSAP
jgi:hypothetical protein